jgi:hypothetical protein
MANLGADVGFADFVDLRCFGMNSWFRLFAAWIEVVLLFRPVCSLVKMDQVFISGC